MATSKQLNNKALSLERQAKALKDKAKRQENIELVLKVFGGFKVSDTVINKAVDVFNAEIKANESKPNNPMKKKKPNNSK